MLLSKGNMVVADVASKDKFQQAMHGVRVNSDGSTVACNGKTMLVVSPVDEGGVRFPSVGELDEIGEDGLVLNLDHVREAMKNLPRTKNRFLQHVALVKPSTAGNVALMCVTESGRKRMTEDAPVRTPYPQWTQLIQKVTKDGVNAKACVNRKDLIALLKSMEAACPDKGDDNPIYIEFGDGLVMRSENRVTGQRAVGVINTYKVRDGMWLQLSEWEKKIFGVVAKVSKAVRKRIRRT